MSKRYKVLVDSREKEKYRYTFPESNYSSGSIVMTLPTGDYTLVGFEDQLCIERKRSVQELSTNLHEDRFYRELERMQTYKWSYLLLEFSLADLYSYPEGANLPPNVRSKIKVTGSYLMKKVVEVMTTYPYVQFLFCGNQYHAYVMCIAIMKRVHESTA